MVGVGDIERLAGQFWPAGHVLGTTDVEYYIPFKVLHCWKPLLLLETPSIAPYYIDICCCKKIKWLEK